MQKADNNAKKCKDSRLNNVIILTDEKNTIIERQLINSLLESISSLNKDYEPQIHT